MCLVVHVLNIIQKRNSLTDKMEFWTNIHYLKKKSKIKIMSKLMRHSHVGIHISNVVITNCSIIIFLINCVIEL